MKRIVTISFILAIVGSIISQLPDITHSDLGSFLKSLWLIPFVLLLFNKPLEYIDKSLSPLFYLLFSFGVYCVILDTFSSHYYLGRDVYNIFVSFSISLVSYKFWKAFGSKEQLKYISLALLLSGFIFSYLIYRDFLDEYDFMKRLYAYNGKNATSLVVLCSSFIPLIILRFKNKIYYIPVLLCSFFMLYVVFLMKSRATYIGFFFLVYFFIFRMKNKYIKRITIILTIIAIIWIFSSPRLYHIIVDGAILASRDVDDLNDVTSGRIYLIGECWELFKQNVWFGNGTMYMDCMPVVMLAQYGIIGAFFVFSFLIVIATKVLSLPQNNPIFLVTFLLFCIFMLNSLFEAQPPFGPGVKCFLLWMFMGFSFVEKRKNSNYHI